MFKAFLIYLRDQVLCSVRPDVSREECQNHLTPDRVSNLEPLQSGHGPQCLSEYYFAYIYGEPENLRQTFEAVQEMGFLLLVLELPVHIGCSTRHTKKKS